MSRPYTCGIAERIDDACMENSSKYFAKFGASLHPIGDEDIRFVRGLAVAV